MDSWESLRISVQLVFPGKVRCHSSGSLQRDPDCKIMLVRSNQRPLTHTSASNTELFSEESPEHEFTPHKRNNEFKQAQSSGLIRSCYGLHSKAWVGSQRFAARQIPSKR